MLHRLPPLVLRAALRRRLHERARPVIGVSLLTQTHTFLQGARGRAARAPAPVTRRLTEETERTEFTNGGTEPTEGERRRFSQDLLAALRGE
jgi:hypothetical protein